MAAHIKDVFKSHWWLTVFVLFFPLFMMAVYSDFIRGSEFNARLGWLILLGGVAYLFSAPLLQKIWLSIVLFFAISGSLDLIYAITFGGVFTSSTFEAIALTDASEAFEFFQAYASIENVLVLAVYWLGIFYALKTVQFTAPKQTRQKVFTALGVLMLLIAIQQVNDRGRAFDVVPGFSGVAIDYYGDHQSIELIVANRKDFYENSQFEAKPLSGKAQTYLVVIGESLGRKHMSLYGYGRETTPRLNAVRDEMVLFSNSISNFAQTHPSLGVNLTAADTLNKNSPYQSVSLVDVFKRAGFKVFWISNQQPLRSSTKPLASLAAEQHFISNDFHGVEVSRYDGYMLPAIERAVNDSAQHKVIFVHMMGSHLQYKNRYPASDSLFKDRENLSAYRDDISDAQLDYINAYDDSVHYSDKVVGRMIGLLQKLKGVAGLSFWSDHGEEVFDVKSFKGHGPDGVTASMLEVPFFFWRNEHYREAFPKNDKLLLGHIDSPITMEDFFHIAQCLIPVDSSVMDQSKSLCLPTYPETPRMVYGKDYDKELK
ncbi:MAG: lipid A phosphoethanolamine transferase [Gammaproteobacteria bacterium]|nr:lipid A phosphoethanolamine transferase [Gammaproteobacteria bacterium]